MVLNLIDYFALIYGIIMSVFQPNTYAILSYINAK